MRASLSFIVATATATLAMAQADDPVEFYAQLYKGSSDCGTSGDSSASAFLGSMGNCVDRAIPANGSAIMTIGEESVYYLSGWTEAGCTGKVILVQSQPNQCITVPEDVASWSNDESPFGK